jgi:hypothetical protein
MSGNTSTEPVNTDLITVNFTVMFERKLSRSAQVIESFGEQVCESIRKDHGCYIAEVIDSTVIT